MRITFVNNVARALVDRLTVKFAGEILHDTNGYDVIKLNEDLFLTEKERASRISEGIQSEDLSKIRCGSGDKKTRGVAKEIKLNDVYGKRYRIPIDHDILDDHCLISNREGIGTSLLIMGLATIDPYSHKV